MESRHAKNVYKLFRRIKSSDKRGPFSRWACGRAVYVRGRDQKNGWATVTLDGWGLESVEGASGGSGLRVRLVKKRSVICRGRLKLSRCVQARQPGFVRSNCQKSVPKEGKGAALSFRLSGRLYVTVNKSTGDWDNRQPGCDADRAGADIERNTWGRVDGPLQSGKMGWIPISRVGLKNELER